MSIFCGNGINSLKKKELAVEESAVLTIKDDEQSSIENAMYLAIIDEQINPYNEVETPLETEVYSDKLLPSRDQGGANTSG